VAIFRPGLGLSYVLLAAPPQACCRGATRGPRACERTTTDSAPPAAAVAAGLACAKPRPWQNYLLALAVSARSSRPTSWSGRRLVVLHGDPARDGRAGCGPGERVGQRQPRASQRDRLNFKSSGILTELYVQAGQHVHDGQLLAEIDSSSASVALQEAEASLQAHRRSWRQPKRTPLVRRRGPRQERKHRRLPTRLNRSERSERSERFQRGPAERAALTAPRPRRRRRSGGREVEEHVDIDRLGGDAGYGRREHRLGQAGVSSAELTVKSDKVCLAGTKLYAPSAGTIASVSGRLATRSPPAAVRQQATLDRQVRARPARRVRRARRAPRRAPLHPRAAQASSCSPTSARCSSSSRE